MDEFEILGGIAIFHANIQFLLFARNISFNQVIAEHEKTDCETFELS